MELQIPRFLEPIAGNTNTPSWRADRSDELAWAKGTGLRVVPSGYGEGDRWRIAGGEIEDKEASVGTRRRANGIMLIVCVCVDKRKRG